MFYVTHIYSSLVNEDITKHTTSCNNIFLNFIIIAILQHNNKNLITKDFFFYTLLPKKNF